MALLHWRKFVFFDEEYIVDTDLNQLITLDPPKNVLDNGQPFVTVKICCSSSGRGSVLLGDTEGYIYIINKQFQVNSLRANQKLTTHIKQVPKLPVFITCGSDQAGINPLIKLWNPEKTDRLNQPTCIRVIRANSGFTTPTDVTSIECNDTLTVMAVGYKDGTIVLHYGDITRQRRSRFTRPVKISEKPVTGIVMRPETQKASPSQMSGYLSYNTYQVETTAFLSTEDEIFYADLSEKSFAKVQLDHLGCKPKCCCLIHGTENKTLNENLFAVGRDDAVYFYQIDGRGPCLAFEGEKRILYRFRGYLVIVSRDFPSKTDSINMRNRRNERDEVLGLKRYNLNIYDIKNKYIAHSSVIPQIQDIFSEWGQLFVICVNGQVIKFQEKDTQTKLETLFRKDQFGLLIEIARAHQYNEDALTDIYKHYGDHLFRKGDYEGAVAQYIKTIGRSEPSYVIKKFLDSKRISSLTVYLEALHKKSYAMQDHTKLLLNCYSKLRSDDQLKQFIESYEDGNTKFDVEIAIKVLREAGFHEFANYLAKKHKKHESFFRIQMEDIRCSSSALEYMNEMSDPNEIAVYMKRHGRVLLRDEPEQTIAMIKKLCQRSGELRYTRRIYPEEFFHIFIDNNDFFVRLLEQLVEDGTDFATKPVHSLLLELYLNAWRKEKDELMRVTHSDKIMKLLSQPNEKLDLEQALILCRNNRFDEGLIDLYARANLHHLVLQYHIDQDDSLKIIKTCEQYGSQNLNLFMPALVHYARTGDERLSQILKAIEHLKAIPPMVVVEIVLRSQRANLGSIKDYLVRYLSRLHDKILENENAIDQYKDDTEVVRQKIEEFENHQAVFKPSKCSACQGVLDLPSVHFLCNHTYHQNCFHNYSAESDECPICVTGNRKLLDEIGSHETSKTTLNELTRRFTTPCDDMFIDLAQLYGYGLF